MFVDGGSEIELKKPVAKVESEEPEYGPHPRPKEPMSSQDELARLIGALELAKSHGLLGESDASANNEKQKIESQPAEPDEAELQRLMSEIQAEEAETKQESEEERARRIAIAAERYTEAAFPPKKSRIQKIKDGLIYLFTLKWLRRTSS